MSKNVAILRILKERRCVPHFGFNKVWVTVTWSIEIIGHTIGFAKYFFMLLIIAENMVDFEKLFLVNWLVSLHVVHCPFINLTSMGG